MASSISYYEVIVTLIAFSLSLFTLYRVSHHKSLTKALQEQKKSNLHLNAQLDELQLEHKRINLSQTQSERLKSDILSEVDTLFEHVGDLDRMHAEQALTVQNTLEQVEIEGAQASQSSQAALAQIEAGNSDTANLRKTLEELSHVESVMSELSVVIKSVSEHSTEISHIADESRLLSLNASIEAARAGEHGRGFAVVAQSVTDLAGKSASSASEIKSISQSGESHVNTVVSTFSEVMENTQSLLLRVSESYQNIEKGMETSVDSSVALKQHLDAFHASYSEMHTNSKAIFERLNHDLSTVVGKFNGNEVLDISVNDASVSLADYDYLIDVRHEHEFNDELGHIEGTKNINVQSSDFESKLQTLDKTKDYLWICRSGGRSKRAALMALRKGFVGKCHNMDGGMLAWNKAKLSVIRNELR